MERRLRPTGALNRLKALAETAGILIVDFICILLIFKLSLFLRKDVLPAFYAGFPEEVPFGLLGINTIWIFLVWLFFFYYEGLYTKKFSFWDEVKAQWKASFFSTVGIFTIVSIGKLSSEVSRTVIILMGLTALLIIPVARIQAKKIFRRLGLFKRRVLILGAGQTGKLILKALRREPNYGYEVVGFLDDDAGKIGSRIEGVKVHRGVERAGNYLKTCNITDIFIAMPGAGREKIEALVNTLQHKVGSILFVPDIFGMAVTGTTLQHFFHEQAFAIEVKNNLSVPFNIFIKRSFDLIVGSAILVLLFVPALVISFLIRLTSQGPAIFTQERAGRKGKMFKCYKFRTMYLDADKRLGELLSKDNTAKTEWETHWKLKNDPRVTWIGKFLRKTSLDELPQIINVMKGQMSLVGPRPYLPNEVALIGPDIDICLNVRPGITGLWQVSGRSNTSHEYRVALDSWYVRNWNLWLDVVILLKTIRVVVYMEGAF